MTFFTRALQEIAERGRGKGSLLVALALPINKRSGASRLLTGRPFGKHHPLYHTPNALQGFSSLDKGLAFDTDEDDDGNANDKINYGGNNG
jgi:hypothetical protein